jgi:hypothetical protein
MNKKRKENNKKYMEWIKIWFLSMENSNHFLLCSDFNINWISTF